MSKKIMTNEEVEREIVRLEQSPLVHLARVEAEIRVVRRRYLHDLQVLEHRGERLAEEGLTLDMLENGGSMCWD